MTMTAVSVHALSDEQATILAVIQARPEGGRPPACYGGDEPHTAG
jgi:hypothetical protein